MRAEHGDAVELAREDVRRGGAACDVGGAGHGETAVRTLCATQAEVGDRTSLGGADDAGGLGGDERLEVDEVQQRGLEELAVDDGTLDADHGLAREGDVALGDCPHVDMHAEVAQVIEESLLEHGAAAGCLEGGEVRDVLVVEAEVLDELGHLADAACNREAAPEGVVAEEGVEVGLRIHHAGLPEALGHGELIEVGVQRDVGGFCLIGQ